MGFLSQQSPACFCLGISAYFCVLLQETWFWNLYPKNLSRMPSERISGGCPVVYNPNLRNRWFIVHLEPSIQRLNHDVLIRPIGFSTGNF